MADYALEGVLTRIALAIENQNKLVEKRIFFDKKVYEENKAFQKIMSDRDSLERNMLDNATLLNHRLSAATDTITAQAAHIEDLEATVDRLRDKLAGEDA